MYHLKLVKALSYSGIVTATKKKPDVFVEDKAVADMAIASGYFKLIGETEEADNCEEGVLQTGYFDEDDLLEMKFDDLKRFAANLGIDTKGFRSKADYIKAIAAVAVTPDPAEDDPEADGNEVDYGEGSPTMVDLQEQ